MIYKLLKTNTLASLLLIASLVAQAALANTEANTEAEITEQRQQELAHLIKHDCGSCHGMTLKGGLGPSLLPESLQGKPDELLFITIREGRHGTPMPPWKTQLSEGDVNWIIQALRKGPNNE